VVVVVILGGGVVVVVVVVVVIVEVVGVVGVAVIEEKRQKLSFGKSRGNPDSGCAKTRNFRNPFSVIS